MDYFEIKAVCPVELTDIGSAEMIEAGALGAAIDDGITPQTGEYVPEELRCELIYTGEATVTSYAEDNDSANDLIEDIKLRLRAVDEAIRVDVKKINDGKWAVEWKKYFRPFSVGENIYVKPTWESFEAPKGSIVIEIDPGMAFGSGTHETTRMCISLISKYMNRGDAVADVGCGSGILGIAAAYLGASDVKAFDYDQVSVDVTDANMRQNGFAFRAQKSDLLKDALPFQANLLVANIISDVIIRLNGAVKPFLAKNAVYIVSGIIDLRLGDVLASLEKNGFHIIETVGLGEWRTIAATADA